MCEENRLIISELQKRCSIIDDKFGVKQEDEYTSYEDTSDEDPDENDNKELKGYNFFLIIVKNVLLISKMSEWIK